ncbi:hypothetical protein Bpla01_26710 [Burkholderia plantarii]|nr:hypothetical protein Bpla01_26710 [Burkholderia plantarii]
MAGRPHGMRHPVVALEVAHRPDAFIDKRNPAATSVGTDWRSGRLAYFKKIIVKEWDASIIFIK